MNDEPVKLTYEAKILMLKVLKAGEISYKQLEELMQKLNYPLINIFVDGKNLNLSLRPHLNKNKNE